MEHAANPVPELPGWVPRGAQNYLAHTEAGVSIRAIARRSGQHASTVLRQIRKVETQRDDPLIDAALRKLSETLLRPPKKKTSSKARANAKECEMSVQCDLKTESHQEDVDRETIRILRRLCERGAVLAVATDMEKAIVVREDACGASQRTAVVDRDVAETMALKDWISAKQAGRVTRYRITQQGRAALEDALASGDGADGFAEDHEAFGARAANLGEKQLDDPETGQRRAYRYNLSESPLTALARRRDKMGQPFLSDALVTAGERLREDFELAQMGPNVAQNWDRFLTGGGRGSFSADSGVGHGPEAARSRVADALEALGPGLGDVALRCCCFLEGLEAAEKRLGWSARSGKIVLRIALQQLRRHYEDTLGPGGGLIG